MARTKLERDIGALALRLTVGGLMLFHGVDKVVGGVDWLGPKLAEHGLPAFVAYGVYAGEVLAPLLLILGVATRTGAALIVATMVFAVWLTHPGDVFSLGSHGEYALELQVLYAVGAAVVALIGPGRWTVPVPRWARSL